MSRPKCRRRIRGDPGSFYFKPVGVRRRDLEEVVLKLDEFEAVRLVDSEGMSQERACEKMEISQSTLSRILGKARHKISFAIVEGFSIKIEKK